jgi:asparagine synthase (glutamine-hydrolysing)
MCGLAGFLRPAGVSASVAEQTVDGMSAALTHRGPDDTGTWLDANAGIALGHRRLAILDLSPAGHQPMICPSGRYVIAYNGEIYNHLEIRKALETAQSPPRWRGHSDTETLLAGFDSWGVGPTLGKTVGMFAIALWDRQSRTLTLARDRVGEKPLYYGWQGDVFLFGSELKALRAHPAFRAEVDREVLAMYMRRGYIVAPHSIYLNIRKLLPGTYVQLSVNDAPGTAPRPQAYWSLRDAAERGSAHPFDGSDEEATDQLEVELKRAVSQQSVADVPLGAFLSGGIDSTTVVALLQAQSSRPVKTFTIGFHESDYQEAQHAASVAKVLGTEHSELYVTPHEARDVIPKLPVMYDEPFGDSSAIPTHLVAQFARRHVAVSLSGDGGDELFGGYTRYQSTHDIWRAMSRIPGFARSVLSYGCRAYARRSRTSSSGWKASRLALYLSARTAEECYTAKVLQHQDAHELVLRSGGRVGLQAWGGALDVELSSENIYDRMMYADALTYLPDDILAKVDRAAMSVSLETRIPLLDHRVVEFVWRLPLHMKVRNRESKWLLKRLLYRHVPAALMERPKMGFGVPVNEWLRGPLREWAEELLAEARLRREGFLNPALVREQWSRHIDRTSTEGDSLWQVLMFQAWLATSAHTQSMHAGRAA